MTETDDHPLRHAGRPPSGRRVHDPARGEPDRRWRSRRARASREFQNGVAFAAPADPGRRPRRRRHDRLGVVGAIGEIAGPPPGQRGPPARERAAGGREHPAPGDPAGERAADRRCSSSGTRSEYRDGRRGGHRPRVERGPPVRHDLDRARTTASQQGDVVDRARAARSSGGSARPGRTSPIVTLISDRSSTVIGQTETSTRDRRGRRPARRRADHAQHRLDRAGPARRAGRDRRHRARRRDPLAVSQGPADRRGHRRPAGAQRGRPDRLPPADGGPRQARIRARHPRLRRRPAGPRRHADRLQPDRLGRPCPAASSRASSRARLRAGRPLCYPDGDERDRPRRRDRDPACSR